MLCVAGLGNPGEDYRDTRHNLGQMLLDRLCQRNACRKERPEGPCRARPCTVEGDEVFLVRTSSYMNVSGPPIRDFLQRTETRLDDLLVAYDDVDLELGQIKLRRGGGAGGHRGVASLISALGDEEFPRLRLGIGRPPGRREMTDWVLEPFRRSEEPMVRDMLDRAAEAAETWVLEGLESAMNRFNRRPEAGTETPD